MTISRLENGSDGALMLWLDTPAHRDNVISRDFWRELETLCQQVALDRPARMIVASASRESFISGADLRQIQQMSDADAEAFIMMDSAPCASLKIFPA
jgi:enoyl-CoA hydratase/carnithine racemase